MTRQLTYVLIGDGRTDRALVPIVDWAIHRLDPLVEILEPDFYRRTEPVEAYLAAFDAGGNMIVFVHRDAEGEALEDRLREFDGIEREDVVPVVPVRMTETWLLVSGPAIARAADRPDVEVTVPGINKLEALVDPKSHLESLLVRAAGDPTGRRRKRLQRSIGNRRVSVSSLIEDFTPLESLPAFQRFQADLKARYPYRHLL